MYALYEPNFIKYFLIQMDIDIKVRLLIYFTGHSLIMTEDI